MSSPQLPTVALADAIGDDSLLCAGDGGKDALVALGAGFMRLHARLFLADEAPHFVKLYSNDEAAD